MIVHWATFDGDTTVGSAGVFGFQMRVPGALAAVAGMSFGCGASSHRRQGILSALMPRQLADVRELGEAVAVLFGSESGIYGVDKSDALMGRKVLVLQERDVVFRHGPVLERELGVCLDVVIPAGCSGTPPLSTTTAYLPEPSGIASDGRECAGRLMRTVS